MMKREVVVIGAGPGGLAAAIEASGAGAQVLCIDLNLKPGGQLFKQIHKFFGSSAHRSGTRGTDIGKIMLEEAQKNGVEMWLGSTVIGLFPGNKVGVRRGMDSEKSELVTIEAKTIIVAAGASENVVRFEGWTTPGVMGAGAAQTMVNVNYVKPGNKVVMLGSGNVGLIVSYQLMQAGCEVVALVEAAPRVGGYAVHASKITRAGVPIYTKRTIKKVIADEETGRVCKVITVGLDDKFAEIAGSELELEADTVAIGAGLKPVTELLSLLNCEFIFHPVAGRVPMHNENMETSVSGVFIAGDTTGVEEANTAHEEGKLAGVAVAEKLGYMSAQEASKLKCEINERLRALRMGPFGEKREKAKRDIIESFGKIACEKAV